MQDVIALFIVALAVFYTIYSVVKAIRRNLKSSSACGSGCGCSAKKDIHRFLKEQKRIKPEQLKLN